VKTSSKSKFNYEDYQMSLKLLVKLSLTWTLNQKNTTKRSKALIKSIKPSLNNSKKKMRTAKPINSLLALTNGTLKDK
jgi:hypothetical protein